MKGDVRVYLKIQKYENFHQSTRFVFFINIVFQTTAARQNQINLVLLSTYSYFCSLKHVNGIMNIYAYAPERDFIMPYLQRALDGAVFSEAPDTADRCIMISSVDIYQQQEGNLIGEDAETDHNSPWTAYEKRFAEMCAAAGKAYIILRSADVVGTGMSGWPRELAERIWKGSLMHFAGNEARVSVVHATDVARTVAALCESSTTTGVFNITDGDNPTFRDFVDSLAFRMKDKHVSTLSTKGQLLLGRIFYGKRLYRKFTTERTFDCSALCRVIDYRPTAVTHYLRNHVYDESSL